MAGIVEDDQSEPQKLMQMAFDQNRRRMSASWTENIESSSEQKSPLTAKSPDSKAGSSRPSSLNDEVKDERKDEKQDRKTTKRDSIKDQLMKFKIKVNSIPS
ncbi:hypothetical protein KIN20_033270 [Parelaphostrongylus tenuis]|uniref:Uncharacterized protein n=1 Tax=Parelaphostrongylus tenuis TaxID=148309 RepID=A0AAD5R877_PARTN|nr:hypothetical protein KIN20_033270 [Parelaphostrongylus tenuis]